MYSCQEEADYYEGAAAQAEAEAMANEQELTIKLNKMSEKIYPKGIMCFQKNEKAPDFVLGTMVINPNQLMAWLRENEGLMSEYKGEKQLRCQVLNGNKGIYLQVDTYKKAENVDSKDGLPF